MTDISMTSSGMKRSGYLVAKEAPLPSKALYNWIVYLYTQTELGECNRVHVTTRGWIFFFQKVNCVDVSMKQTENFDRVFVFQHSSKIIISISEAA